jgi:filamentous hemagglutinin family protein
MSQFSLPSISHYSDTAQLFMMVGGCLVFLASTPCMTRAQNTTSITSTPGNGDIGTTVTQTGPLYNITGGTRAGTNLFHSFGNFSVGAGDTANFLNTPINGSLPTTTNILGRVTGGNVSNIFGRIQTTNFGSANLFLINPGGFLFGPGATMSVGGVVAFTSADYLRLADGARFNAVPNVATDALLSTAPVVAFGFLGSNPGAITVQGSQLTVTERQGISLVGGDITIESGTLNHGITKQPALLSAPGGQINLVSVGSPGEVPYPTLQTGSNISGQSFSTMGNITVSGSSLLDVSGDAAGMIRIRGGQLVINEGALSADTVHTNGSTAVDIKLAGELSISNDLAPAITARTTGLGDAGEVKIEASSVIAHSDTHDMLSLIDTSTSGEGRGGNVNITTKHLQVTGSSEGFSGFIDTGTRGPGPGGDVTIVAKDILVDSSVVTSGTYWANAFGMDATGAAGNVTINSGTIDFSFGGIDTGSFSFARNSGRAGNITIQANDLRLSFSLIQSQGIEHGGAIRVEADSVSLAESRFETQTVHTPSGGISIMTKSIDLTQGSQLISTTGGDGDAGAININASERVRILEGSRFVRPSGIFSQSFGTGGSSGNAGDIVIATPQLQLAEGGRVNSVTKSSGRGGNVTIRTDAMSISGEFPDEITEPLFNLGPIHQSGIFTLTAGGNCVSPCGKAGNISISAGSLAMGNGSQIDSGTSNTGLGGNVTIRSVNQLGLSGSLSDGSPVGIFSRSIGTASDAGSGGNIALTAGQSVTIKNGAAVSASSDGPGNAGTISINAGQQLNVLKGSITTQAARANGGNIDIRAIDMVRLVNSEISTSVKGAEGSGGNIFIDPNVVILQGSNVTAQAVGGAGGNITFVTPLFLMDSASVVSATSLRGPSGTVTIQSPLSNLSSTVAQLVSKTGPPQVLLQNRCIALADSGQSTFILAGRNALPAEPGGWLSSPIAMEHWMGEATERASGLMVQRNEPNNMTALPPQTNAMNVLSLRRLSPPGFLVRSFATGSTGCPS